MLAALTQPRLTGTFLQLSAGHLEWPESRWQQLFGYFKALRLDRLIVQWTADEDVSFVSVLDRILALATDAGMRVTIGLRNELSFWRRNASNRAAAFAGIYQRTQPLIAELAPYAKRPAFEGWYISQEFDDVNWSRIDNRQAGGDFLRGMARALRDKTPRSRVSVSAFANGVQPPADYARLWRGVVRHAKLDEVLFQDGVGVGKLTIDQAAGYLRAMQAQLGHRSGAVVETFTQIRDDPFQARSADADRIRRQLESASQCGYRSAVAFSVPEYVTPLGVTGAAELYAEFASQTRP